MELLREKYPEAPTDTVWKDYYDKGHEISFNGAYCVNCNEYVVDMSECFQIPECKDNTKTIEPLSVIDKGISSIRGPTLFHCDNLESFTISRLVNSAIGVTEPGGRLLLNITYDGTVEADSIENACLAGKMFVESIRYFHPNSSSDIVLDSKSDKILNKTEDLVLLSKILDVMKNENIAEAVALIHASRKSDRDHIDRLLREIDVLKEEYQEKLLNVSTD